jgi:hypothetical protein
MATAKQQNRQTLGNSRGGSSGAVDMGIPSGVDMAAKDADKFLVGLIIMALVFALLLPLTAIMYIDILAIRTTIRAEAKELRKLKEEIKPKKEKEDE